MGVECCEDFFIDVYCVYMEGSVECWEVEEVVEGEYFVYVGVVSEDFIVDEGEGFVVG